MARCKCKYNHLRRTCNLHPYLYILCKKTESAVMHGHKCLFVQICSKKRRRERPAVLFVGTLPCGMESAISQNRTSHIQKRCDCWPAQSRLNIHLYGRDKAQGKGQIPQSIDRSGVPPRVLTGSRFFFVTIADRGSEPITAIAPIKAGRRDRAKPIVR